MVESKAERTRQKLIDAALKTIAERGLAHVSVRQVAEAAGVNQALVFYHFETLNRLVAAAYDVSVAQAAKQYHSALMGASSLVELIDRARELVAREGGRGNTALMAQLFAQAQYEDVLRDVAQRALLTWRGVVHDILEDALTGSFVRDVVDQQALEGALVAGMLGEVLVESVGTPGVAKASAFDILESAAHIIEALDHLPGPARRAIVTSFKHGMG